MNGNKPLDFNLTLTRFAIWVSYLTFRLRICLEYSRELWSFLSCKRFTSIDWLIPTLCLLIHNSEEINAIPEVLEWKTSSYASFWSISICYSLSGLNRANIDIFVPRSFEFSFKQVFVNFRHFSKGHGCTCVVFSEASDRIIDILARHHVIRLKIDALVRSLIHDVIEHLANIFWHLIEHLCSHHLENVAFVFVLEVLHVLLENW